MVGLGERGAGQQSADGSAQVSDRLDELIVHLEDMLRSADVLRESTTRNMTDELTYLKAYRALRDSVPRLREAAKNYLDAVGTSCDEHEIESCAEQLRAALASPEVADARHHAKGNAND